MAENNIYVEGNDLPVTEEVRPKTPLPEPETQAKLSNLNQARGPVPRAPRFSKLGDAYFTITSRQRSNDTFRKASNQSDLSPDSSSLAGPASSPVTSSRLVKSQNDLQTPGSVSATPSPLNIERQIIFNPIEVFEHLSPKMGHKDKNHLRLSEEIEHELLDLNTQSNDTTGSTIEGILAQYDACKFNPKMDHGNPREHRVNVNLSISQPPQDSLPELPAPDLRPVSVRQSEYDSPIPDSSITDSEHLLDAEAQVYELEQVGRALVPSPLHIAQPRIGTETRRERQHDACDNESIPIAYKDTICTNNSFTHEKTGGYKTYLQPPMERDISQTLRHLGGHAEHSISTLCSSDIGDNVFRHTRPQGSIFSPTRLPKVGGERQVRHIKVVIGRESETGKDTPDHYDAHNNIRNERHDIPSEDSDWVTEATTDAGFGVSSNAVSGRALTKRFKRAGSSIADYSDDGNESAVDRFGSRERIIPHLSGEEKSKCYDLQRLDGSKLAFLLPRPHNAFLRNANRLWESNTQQGPSHFHPRILSQNTKTGQNIGSRRLVFDFDQNAPPKYEFRDSVSEYELAKSNTKSDCGANYYDTYGSLTSSASKTGEDLHNATADAHFDRYANHDGDRDPPNTSSRQSTACQTPRHNQDMRLSIYAADRQRQLKELEQQEFAIASSYYDPPSGSSVRSKFKFELLPLDQAWHKNKQQRESGETNETESARTRLKRKKSFPSLNFPTNNTLERPAPVFFTSRDLSVNFSTPNWRVHDPNPDDTPTPFSMDQYDNMGPNSTRRRQQNIALGSLDPLYAFGMPSITRRPYNGQKEHRPKPARNRLRIKLPPTYIAPDDYVSDRANRIRQLFFYTIAALSILPFVGVLALGGAFKEAFKWATRGEVDRLTPRQRRFIKWMLFIEGVIYTGIVVTVVVYFVVKSKVHH
ncbi:hypothetical protein FHL15_004975 [Xylaria flabelliformis]|uniref:Uncharacterized protein n=1 Tax=Xylaria flabelliformis TaxID=2512241 RepID=A0A553I203_9PEZI|nr:hypothetical protein FHL15_004975 [Xylaria flabelliformis]